jgi:hypothetical protein
MYLDFLLGLIVSLAIGHGVLKWLHRWLHDRIGIEDQDHPVPPWLTGLVERFVFFLLVAFDMPATPVTMMAWLGIKMAANWNRSDSTPPDEEAETKRAQGATAAAVLGLLSMGFALMGGLLFRYAMTAS